MGVCTHRVFNVNLVLENCDIDNLEECIQKVLTKKLGRRNVSVNVKEFTGDDHRYFMDKLKRCKNGKM